MRQVIVFRVDENFFSIDARCVSEIINWRKPVKAPHHPPYSDGIINLRNELITVLSLRKVLELTASESDENRKIMVLNNEGRRTGYVVDSADEIMTIEENLIDRTIITMFPDNSVKVVTGVLNIEDRIIFYCEPEGFSGI